VIQHKIEEVLLLGVIACCGFWHRGSGRRSIAQFVCTHRQATRS
jgi:hypothetical protein